MLSYVQFILNKEYYLSFFLPSQTCRSGDGTSIPGSELTRTRLESGFLPFQSPVLPQDERNILNRSLALTVQRQRFKLETIRPCHEKGNGATTPFPLAQFRPVPFAN